MKNIENKEIAIITFHRAINYGALLQAYALQVKINELGLHSVILDYRNKRLEKIHAKRSLRTSKTLKSLFLNMLIGRHYNGKHDKFRRFLSRHMNLSAPMHTIQEIESHEREYDLFVTGSDQVWNYKITDMDPAYFLGFTHEDYKKRSYAASFGLREIPDSYKQIYSELLSGFNTILIRENQGAKIVKDLLNKEPSTVLDPTMLLTKEEWESMCKDIYPPVDKYILVYAFGGSAYIKELAINISRQTGLKICWISSTYKYNPKIRYIRSAGPEEFISLFGGAEYILTNSFHGTAFSINFNKQFFTELLPESMGVNSRIEDLLELVGLKDRIIKSNDASIINSKIDYEKINKIVEDEREKSILLLKDALDISKE